jgi:hypothetical protein
MIIIKKSTYQSPDPEAIKLVLEKYEKENNLGKEFPDGEYSIDWSSKRNEYMVYYNHIGPTFPFVRFKARIEFNESINICFGVGSLFIFTQVFLSLVFSIIQISFWPFPIFIIFILYCLFGYFSFTKKKKHIVQFIESTLASHS